MAYYLHSYSLIYPFLGLMLLSASCSQEENIGRDDNSTYGRKIEFRASLPEITSRATEVNKDNLDKIQVSAFTVGSTSLTEYEPIQNAIFNKNATTGSFFSSDPKCIWPNNNDIIRFVAFAPLLEDIPHVDEVKFDGYKFSSFKVARDIASQIDFVTAIGSGSLWDNEETPVDLNFKHQLSRIEIKAWGASKSYDIEIAGVRIGGVGTESVFDFSPASYDIENPTAGSWESISKGEVEYIFREGDQLVILDRTANSPASDDKAVSILGKKIGGTSGYENSAMLLPSVNPAWDYKGNAANGDKNNDGMYISVLMRVTDVTPYAPAAPDNIVYPYAGNKEGMEVIYLAVDKATKRSVLTRLYSNGEGYFSDEACTEQYDPDQNSAEVKAFGWASLPVSVDWKAGYVYTYTLNYTNGVGLRNPLDPQPGTPILSDRVLMNVDVAPWATDENSNSGVNVPRK